MFVPDDYQASDKSWVEEVIENNPLALLLTNGSPRPFATHLPVITIAGVGNSLEGMELWGHMNRANPHWKSLTDTPQGTLVFGGASSYISPAWYETAPAAPTWNFISVHLHVIIDPLPPGEQTLEVVAETSRRLESRFGAGWNQDHSIEYFRRILRGVGAFKMTVEASDAMFKLSQDKDAATKERVREGLNRRGHPGDGAMADEICRASQESFDRSD